MVHVNIHPISCPFPWSPNTKIIGSCWIIWIDPQKAGLTHIPSSTGIKGVNASRGEGQFCFFNHVLLSLTKEGLEKNRLPYEVSLNLFFRSTLCPMSQSAFILFPLSSSRHIYSTFLKAVTGLGRQASVSICLCEDQNLTPVPM